MSNNQLAALPAIKDLAVSSLLRPDPAFDNIIANTEKQGIPAIEVSPLMGQFLAVQARLVGAKTVLELGALGGYSTLWFAKTGARVTSLELNPKHRDVALENLHAAGHDAEIILGSALDTLPKLEGEGRKFDMAFIDADWDNQAAYFDWAVKLVRKGGCIVVDNVIQQVMRGEDESLVRGAGANERVLTTLIPVVSVKEPKGKVEELRTFVDGIMVATVL